MTTSIFYLIKRLHELYRFSLLLLIICFCSACVTHQSGQREQADALSENRHPKQGQISMAQAPSTFARFSASFTLPLAELIATTDAAFELHQFHDGNHPQRISVYLADSEGLKELMAGRYYQALTDFLVEQMANWYGGKIPKDGALFTQSDPFRPFSPADAFIEILDGVDMADIVGSMTHTVLMSTDAGMINFLAVNQMSLESYAGQNYLQHNLVENPVSGPFSNRIQIFQWRRAIPEHYRSIEE